MTRFPAPRTVHNAEALAWLAAHPAPPRTSVVTSLPDVSEVAHLDFAGWRAWFIEAARRVIEWVPEDGLAIFFQSDVRHEGAWVDKGYLVMRAAEAVGASIVWHKIVCRKPPGTIVLGRAGYSHMICVSQTPRPTPARPGPEVIADAGYKPWSRAMGETACEVACRFLRDETATRLVVDPFCGKGSVLAVANRFGFEALGVDLSVARCRAARKQRLVPGRSTDQADARQDGGA
jgi:hypothetical protein